MDKQVQQTIVNHNCHYKEWVCFNSLYYVLTLTCQCINILSEEVHRSAYFKKLLADEHMSKLFPRFHTHENGSVSFKANDD